jgi:hypothetical protein
MESLPEVKGGVKSLRKCKVADCTEPCKPARGLCQAHYNAREAARQKTKRLDDHKSRFDEIRDQLDKITIRLNEQVDLNARVYDRINLIEKRLEALEKR